MKMTEPGEVAGEGRTLTWMSPRNLVVTDSVWGRELSCRKFWFFSCWIYSRTACGILWMYPPACFIQWTLLETYFHMKIWNCITYHESSGTPCPVLRFRQNWISFTYVFGSIARWDTVNKTVIQSEVAHSFVMDL